MGTELDSGVVPTRQWLREGALASAQVAVIAILGLGSHATKNALGPAEPVLQALGISPMVFALISAAPILGSVFMPAVWGAAYERNQKLAILAIPLGMFVGQALMACGTMAQARGASELVVAPLLVIGLALFCLSRAGTEVVQHTELVRAVPMNVTNGFVALIACTRFTGASCSWVVPRIIGTGGGIFGVQMALLVPSLLSLCAGSFLACHRKPRPGITELAPCKQKLLEASSPHPSQAGGRPCGRKCQEADSWDSKFAIWLLGLWRAATMGILHSLATVTVGLLVGYGLTLEAAGTLSAQCQWIAIIFLPAVGVLCHFAGRRRLLVVTSLLAFSAGVTLTMGRSLPPMAWHAALHVFAIANIVAPVVPLALVPINTQFLGWAFGLMESLFSGTQIILTVLIGALREAGGFAYAMVLVCFVLGVAVALSIISTRVVKDSPSVLQFRGPLKAFAASGSEAPSSYLPPRVAPSGTESHLPL